MVAIVLVEYSMQASLRTWELRKVVTDEMCTIVPSVRLCLRWFGVSRDGYTYALVVDPSRARQ